MLEELHLITAVENDEDIVMNDLKLCATILVSTNTARCELESNFETCFVVRFFSYQSRRGVKTAGCELQNEPQAAKYNEELRDLGFLGAESGDG